jgi:peptide/nickel transport system permease protein
LPTFFSKHSRGTIIQIAVGSGILSVLVAFAVLGPYLVNPYRIVSPPFQPPSGQYNFGTDILGRDILSRLIVGTRQSLLVAAISVIMSTAFGATLGIVVGYVGGLVDRIANVIMDAWYAFPDLVLALIITVLLGQGAINASIAIAIALVPYFFRVLRSDAFAAKSLTYIEAERVLGASTTWIVFRHLIPSTLPSLIVLMTIGVARAILTLGGLGFLGLGIPPPTPEWGTDLGLATSEIISGIWWPTTFAGLMIFVAVLGFNQLGNGLNSVLVGRKYSRE